MKYNYTFRRTLSALVLLMASTLAWSQSFTADGINYSILNEESVEVGRGAYSGDIVIPSTVTYDDKTYNVTSIGEWAFYNCSALTSIDIPSSVTFIGGWAFYNCSSLTSINIPDGVTFIERIAFHGCSSLTSMTVSENNPIYDSRESCNAIIETASNALIAGCMSTIIPSSVTDIRQYAFSGCSALTSIVIPESVTYISSYAFSDCSSLKSINIPESVMIIGYASFSGCSSLTSITVSENNPIYDSREGCNAIIETASNTLIRGCVNTIIPSSVTGIGEPAFSGCSSLTSIDIPDGVTSIGGNAFRNCSSLTSINIPGSVTSIGNYAFYYCSSLESIDIPESVTSIGSSTFDGCTSLTSINIPDGVTSIGDDAFYRCSSLTSIVIPESVTSIGKYAFQLCSSVESINIPESVTSIEEATFAYCSRLVSVDIPDGVTSIGERAFYDCSSLESINIPDGVTSIGERAFSDCSSLTTIICRAENVPELGGDAFGYYYYYEFDGEYYGGSQRLYVPASALEDYKAATYWKNFRIILPIVELDYALKESWNTIVLPFSTDLEPFGEGVKAYAFTGATDGVLSFSPANSLKANTPYIIYAPEAQELSLNNFHDTTDPNATTAPSVEHNGVTFRGTYEDIDAPDMEGKYGVTNDGHIMEGTNEASIKAYHAYFEVAAGAEVKAISFDGDDATGIIEIADALQQGTQYYNLAGQRTQKPQKGVNIVNGKKVLY